MDEHKRTGPVVLRAGTTVRRVDVWAGTRTQTSERLMTGRPFPSETHYLTPERTRWQPAFDLPIGEVVTTARGREHPVPRRAGWPGAAWLRCRLGSRVPGRRRRGAHGLRDGVHRVGASAYFAERCTARHAFYRRATKAEVEALRG